MNAKIQNSSIKTVADDKLKYEIVKKCFVQ